MKNILFVVFLLFSFNVFSQSKEDRNLDRGCQKVKTGKFNYKQVPNAYSIREKDKQVSYNPDGIINTFRIEWVNDCQFIMTYVESNKEQKTYQKGDTIQVFVDNVNGDCYTFTSYFKGRKYPPTDMCRME